MSERHKQDRNFQGKRLLSVQEAAFYLNLSDRTVYNRICRNAKNPFPFKVKRLGRLRKFDIRNLEEYVNSI